jgi:hypothetical protein
VVGTGPGQAVNSASAGRQRRPGQRGHRPRAVVATLALASALALGAALAGCGAQAPGPGSAAPQPPVVPGLNTAGPDLTGVQLPNFVMPLIKGGISRPDKELTPGDVTTTDTDIVCSMPAHGISDPIPTAMQTAVFDEYGLTTQTQQSKYILDYLVPYDLGGATDVANVWPAAIQGTGFYEKVQTDQILHELVCRRSLSLTQAQHDLETDWYAAWLRYVVATGHV